MKMEIRPALTTLETTRAKILAKISASQFRKIILCAIICTAPLLILSVIFWRRKHVLMTFTPKSSEPIVDFTKPDIHAAPIDLTTVGAATELPDNHPLRQMNGVRPSEVAPFHNAKLTDAQLAQNFTEIDARLQRLEQPDHG